MISSTVNTGRSTNWMVVDRLLEMVERRLPEKVADSCATVVTPVMVESNSAVSTVLLKLGASRVTEIRRSSAGVAFCVRLVFLRKIPSFQLIAQLFDQTEDE